MTIEYASLDDVWNVPSEKQQVNKKKRKNDVMCELLNKQKSNIDNDNVIDEYLDEYQYNNGNGFEFDHGDTYKTMTNLPINDESHSSSDIVGVDDNILANSSYSYEDLMNNNDCSILNEKGNNNYSNTICNSVNHTKPFKKNYIDNTVHNMGHKMPSYQQTPNTTSYQQVPNTTSYQQAPNTTSDEQHYLLDEELNDESVPDVECNYNMSSNKELLFDLFLYIVSGVILIFVMDQMLNLGLYMKK